jgi:putative ABC transport system permease protein
MDTKMVVSNLLHRPARTIISILAIALEVGMVMLVVGMTTGMLNETSRRIEGVGADILVQPPNSSFLLGVTNAPMPIKIGDYLQEKVPHILHVAPVLLQFNIGGGINIIYGIDIEQFNQVSGGFVYHSGGPFVRPDDIIVDDLYAKANRLTVGKTLNLLNHTFHICGIVEHGKGARLFIPIKTAEEMAGTEDKASIIFIKCTDPGYIEDVVNNIHQVLPKYEVRSIPDFMSQYTSNNLPTLNTFITAMISVAIGIGFLVIFLSMYTTITERTREIGILKSLGASKAYIMEVILREAAILCLVGIVAGEVGTVVVRRMFETYFPTLYILLTPQWGLYAALLALAGTLLGAAYPALRAASLDPVDALAYE